MSTTATRSADPRQGASIVEVLVAMMVFSVAVLSLAGAGLAVSKELEYGRGYVTASMAAQATIDSLISVASTLDTGSADSTVVSNIDVSWEVVGSDIKTLVVVVQRDIDRLKPVPDSFFTRIPE